LPLLPAGVEKYSTLLIYLLLGNIIYVGLVTIAQKRLDWMLGYSSVMHMGYIFLGIASGTCRNERRGRLILRMAFPSRFSSPSPARFDREQARRARRTRRPGKLMPRPDFFRASCVRLGRLPGIRFTGEVMVLFTFS
jgi:NADH-quinone oxidoreductase subunit M